MPTFFVSHLTSFRIFSQLRVKITNNLYNLCIAYQNNVFMVLIVNNLDMLLFYCIMKHQLLFQNLNNILKTTIATNFNNIRKVSLVIIFITTIHYSKIRNYVNCVSLQNTVLLMDYWIRCYTRQCVNTIMSQFVLTDCQILFIDFGYAAILCDIVPLH